MAQLCRPKLDAWDVCGLPQDVPSTEGLGGMRRLPLLAEDEKKPTNHDGSYASPHWNVDILLLLYGELDWAEAFLFDCARRAISW